MEPLAVLAPGIPEEFTSVAMLAVAEEQKRRQVIEEIHSLEAGLPAPWRWVQCFNRMRLELLARRLAEASRAFCTHCRRIQLAKQLHPTLLAGQRISQVEGSTGRIIDMEGYAEVHQLCESCEQKVPQARRILQLLDGRRAELYCQGWPAKEQAGSWCYKESGGWRTVPDTAKLAPKVRASHLTMPSHEVVAIERDWRLPPELFYDFGLGVYVCNELGRTVAVS